LTVSGACVTTCFVMSEPRQIDVKYLPTRLPVISTAVVYLLLDRHNAPGWVWGVFITLYALYWLGAAAVLYRAKWVKPSEI
jgi:hypothetical protein